MKQISIVGDNYSGSWQKSRTSCRAILLQGTKMLCSYEKKLDQWVIPGGGLEAGESARECCVREVAEETGLRITVSDCVVQIDEYYEDFKLTACYFIGTVVGKAEQHLTAHEIDVGLEPRWREVTEMLSVFGAYETYAATDEDRRGLYLREFTALNAVCTHRPPREIHTERLLLRAIEQADAEAIHFYATDPSITMMLFYPHGSMAETEAFAAASDAQWQSAEPAIFSYVMCCQDKIIGGIDLEVSPVAPNVYELGWLIHADYRNKGYTTEAGEALLKIAFTALNAEQVIAHCDAQNAASAHVMRKIGMTLTHTDGTRTYPKTGKTSGEFAFAITKADYEKLHGKDKAANAANGFMH